MDFLQHIQRPALLLDEVRCRANIRRMAEKARLSKVVFRPHFKSHQSATIGEWFREEGVSSITVSSVEMAGYFADAGWTDITVAFPVNLREMDEIDRLAGRIRLNLLVNDPGSLLLLEDRLKNQVGFFVEIDTGYHRSGIAPEHIPLMDQLVRQSGKSRKLHFRGFLSHFGESYLVRGQEKVRGIYGTGVSALRAVRNSSLLFQEGLISIGDTPCCSVMNEFPGVDEIRPGNFLFYDVMQLNIGACESAQIAICLVVPVVEVHPDRGEAIVYGGAVHLSKDHIAYNGEKNFGLVVRLTCSGWSDPLPGCAVTAITQEHGILRMDPLTLPTFRPGDLIGILPVHACLTADAMKHYITLGGKPIPMFTGV